MMRNNYVGCGYRVSLKYIQKSILQRLTCCGPPPTDQVNFYPKTPQKPENEEAARDVTPIGSPHLEKLLHLWNLLHCEACQEKATRAAVVGASSK